MEGGIEQLHQGPAAACGRRQADDQLACLAFGDVPQMELQRPSPTGSLLADDLDELDSRARLKGEHGVPRQDVLETQHLVAKHRGDGLGLLDVLEVAARELRDLPHERFVVREAEPDRGDGDVLRTGRLGQGEDRRGIVRHAVAQQHDPIERLGLSMALHLRQTQLQPAGHRRRALRLHRGERLPHRDEIRLAHPSRGEENLADRVEDHDRDAVVLPEHAEDVRRRLPDALDRVPHHRAGRVEHQRDVEGRPFGGRCLAGTQRQAREHLAPRL